MYANADRSEVENLTLSNGTPGFGFYDGALADWKKIVTGIFKVRRHSITL
jgi:hypothetical protein